MNDPAADPTIDRRRFVRDLAAGIVTVGFVLWLTFFGTEGFVELATLAAAIAMLIWFATVEPHRLMDRPRQPSTALFLLAVTGFAIVLTAALIIGTGTLLLIALLTFVAVAVGLGRAIAYRYRQPVEGDDGIS